MKYPRPTQQACRHHVTYANWVSISLLLHSTRDMRKLPDGFFSDSLLLLLLSSSSCLQGDRGFLLWPQ